MVKELLGFVGVHGSSEAVIKTLTALSQQHKTHTFVQAVAGVPYYELISGDPIMGVMSVDAARDARKIYEADAQVAVEKLTTEINRQGFSISVEPMIEGLSMLFDRVATRGKYTDLSVIGPVKDFHEPWCWTQIVEALLFETGRPLLVVPPRGATTPFNHAVFAWNGRREAVRAWHEARQWLAPGARVDILIVDPHKTRHQHGAEPGADMAAVIARQNHVTEVHRIESGDKSVAETMQAFTASRRADILIMGAYGHSRVREFLFGGATRDVLEGTHVPIFLSH
jgi:nucleotide-binding universal stress UspA family protein